MNRTQLLSEFDRQEANLLHKQYPNAANLTEDQFLDLVEPLREVVGNFQDAPDVDIENGKLPFVIVVAASLVSAEQQMSATQRNGKQGVTILRPHTSADFKTILSLNTPQSPVYLLIDIDRGKESINLPPCEALKLIRGTNRSPLTIEEGIALITHFPEFLIKNNCFSLLASRTGSDQRVPAIWINATKQPNLGWCWDGNPHTWLGSASCQERIDIKAH